MDVNAEVAYVSSLKECENQFPLFAACEGINENKLNYSAVYCQLFDHYLSDNSHLTYQQFSLQSSQI